MSRSENFFEATTDYRYDSVEALLDKAPIDLSTGNVFSFADKRIEADLDDLTAVCDDKVLSLRPKEFVLVALLASRAGTAVPKSVVAESIRGRQDEVSNNVLYVTLARTREKFGCEELSSPANGAIQTIRDYGLIAVSSLDTGKRRVIWNRDPAPELYVADGRLATKPKNMVIKVDGVLKLLPKHESQLLDLLVSRTDKPVSYSTLSKKLWGYTDSYTVRHLHALAAKLRSKFGDEIGDPDSGAIQTIRGIGYKIRSSLEK